MYLRKFCNLSDCLRLIFSSKYCLTMSHETSYLFPNIFTVPIILSFMKKTLQSTDWQTLQFPFYMLQKLKKYSTSYYNQVLHKKQWKLIIDIIFLFQFSTNILLIKFIYLYYVLFFYFIVWCFIFNDLSV